MVIMTAQEIRQRYFDFMVQNGHNLVPRALLIPQNDPTTLFTGSGMQPLIPYLLGETHPDGKRIVDSQTCFRAEDMDEVGDNRHTTFFEMLGNWSLGDYYKAEQLEWFFTFLVDEVGLDPKNLFVTCFSGDENSGVAKDADSAEVWKDLFNSRGITSEAVDVGTEEDGYKTDFLTGNNRIFYYDAKKNWWSRNGVPANMPVGEPGGPDSEVFYDFGTPHDEKWGKYCHPNCDCGRFLEIGNSVFMAYKKTKDGFEELPAPNVDFGGGLERIAAAALGNPDVFKISLLWPIIEGLELLSGKKYADHTQSMRVIADHLRAAMFLIVDGAHPSNKEQGYVVRRLMRRAIRYAFDLGIEQDLCEKVAPIIAQIYRGDFPELLENEAQVVEAMVREEKLFRTTLRKGIHELEKLAGDKKYLTSQVIFKLYDTYGFPVELVTEEATALKIELEDDWRIGFDSLMKEQRERSQSASQGMFKGGLADHSEQVVKYHTTTHLMYQALNNVLGGGVVQRGSNITAERTRFDFFTYRKGNTRANQTSRGYR